MMKKVVFVLAITFLNVLLCSFSYAQTQMSGEVCDATTLTNWRGGADYLITDDLYVCCGKMTVNDGVEIDVSVDANDPVTIYVGYDSNYCSCTCGIFEGYGRVDFKDTNSTTDTLVTSAAGTPSPGDWHGFQFRDSIVYQNKLYGTTFEYGGGSDGAGQAGLATLYVLGNNTEIVNSIIRYSEFNGVFFHGDFLQDDYQFYASEVYGCGSTTPYGGDIGHGIIIGSGEARVKINYSCIHDNLVCGISHDGLVLEVDNSNIEDNDGGGIIVGHNANATITNSFITGNGETGIDGWHFGIYVSEYSTSLTISDSCIHGNMLGSGGNRYQLVNYSDEDVSAENVYWGTTLPGFVPSLVYDYYDNPAKGIIDYSPISTSCSLSSCE